MTQFRIDVVVNPRRAAAGIQTVKRSLTSLDKKANKTALLMRKIFAGLGVIFAIKQLAQLGDAFTNLQNRLRVVTSGQRELVNVTEDLLQVANRSRSSFESTAELYSRMALATRELNLEGANLVEITESINKAIILSGASAKEANNGLIQLSQGLASGRLTGDELRSTLEQLPVVADVIAKQMGVTRGELRALGAEGKITSIKIIRAFQSAKDSLDAGFAKTVPTLSQSFVVLRNNVTAFVGRINEGTGILRGFGNAIRFVGTELETIVKTLAVIGVTAGAIKIAPLVQQFFALSAAIKAGTAVRLGSIAAINLQNKFLAEQAAANLANAAASLASTDAIITSIRIESLSNAIKKGNIGLLFEQEVLERRLQGAQAARATQLATLIAAEKAHGAAALTAGKNVTFLSRSLDKAKTALKTFTLFLAANPVGIFVVALGTLVAALAIFRNDIKLTEGGLATLGDFVNEFFSQVKAAVLAVVEFFGRVFEPLVTAVKEAVGIVEFDLLGIIKVGALVIDSLIGLFLGGFKALVSIFFNLPKAIGSIFIQLVNGAIAAFEFLPDVIIAILKTLGQTLKIFISGQLAAFQLLGAAAQQALVGNFQSAADLTKAAGKASAAAFESATKDVGSRFVSNLATELDDELIPRLNNPFKDGFKNLGKNAFEAFVDGASFSGVRDFVTGLATGAEDRAQQRAAAEAAKEKARIDKDAAIAAQKRADAIAKILNPLQAENRLVTESIALGSREAGIRDKLRQITEKLAEAGVKLTFFQKAATEGLVRQTAARAEALSTAAGLQTADQILVERLRALKNAYDEGTISLRVFNEAQREAEIVALEASTNFGDGWAAGIMRAKDELMDFGQTAQNIIGTAIPALMDGLTDSFQATFSFLADALTDSEASWVDYREAIKATMKSAIDAILNEIAKLIIQLIILKIFQTATGTGPGPGAGASLDPSAGSTISPGAIAGINAAQKADGGLVTANKPFLVGEEGPEIFTPGQTGSITPTDQTIGALTSGAANRQETVVVQAPAPEVSVNTIVVDDPSKIPAGIESPDGKQAIRNVIRQERSGIKRDLG